MHVCARVCLMTDDVMTQVVLQAAGVGGAAAAARLVLGCSLWFSIFQSKASGDRLRLPYRCWLRWERATGTKTCNLPTSTATPQTHARTHAHTCAHTVVAATPSPPTPRTCARSWRRGPGTATCGPCGPRAAATRSTRASAAGSLCPRTTEGCAGRLLSGMPPASICSPEEWSRRWAVEAVVVAATPAGLCRDNTPPTATVMVCCACVQPPTHRIDQITTSTTTTSTGSRTQDRAERGGGALRLLCCNCTHSHTRPPFPTRQYTASTSWAGLLCRAPSAPTTLPS
jgi:hypothetical protein